MNSRSILKKAFTLIELLTVIAIIAILMGLLFPAISIVKEAARKVQAKNDVAQIVTAVKAYNVEYGKYPPIEETPKDATLDAICGSDKAKCEIDNNQLFNTLRAIPLELNSKPTAHSMNPRRVIFFEGKSVSNPAQPKGGFLDKEGSDKRGCFYDPWGEQYCVIIDQNYDNLLNNPPLPYTDFDDNTEPRAGVGAFALGKDGKLGDDGKGRFKENNENTDDIISWQ